MVVGQVDVVVQQMILEQVLAVLVRQGLYYLSFKDKK
jgi:hypothetical protein